MEKIEANMILEILGRPKEHIVSALNTLLTRLSQEQGIVIKQKKVHEPVEVKDSKDLFTTFAEVEIQFESMLHYFGVLFAYMPANIEIIYPEQIVLKNEEMTAIGNRLIQRLHDYDAITKKMIADRDFLAEKLKEYAPHLFKKKEVKAEPKIEEKKQIKKAKEKKPKKSTKNKKQN